MRKRKRRFTLYRLPGDPLGTTRKLGIARRVKAVSYLDRVYGRGRYTLMDVLTYAHDHTPRDIHQP